MGGDIVGAVRWVPRGGSQASYVAQPGHAGSDPAWLPRYLLTHYDSTGISRRFGFAGPQVDG